MAVPHFAVNLRFRHQGCYRIDNDNVKGARADKHIGYFQRLLAIIRLGDDQGIGINAQLTRIIRVKRMLSIYECCNTAILLGIGDCMQGNSRFT